MEAGDVEFDRFYWYLMGIEPRIKFTMEREKKWNPSFHGHSHTKGREKTGNKGLQKENSYKQIYLKILEIKPLKEFSFRDHKRPNPQSSL